MSQIILDVPDDVLALLHLTPEALASEMRLATAAHLYDLERMTMHQAARFAGVDEFAFRQRLGGYGVNVFTLTRAELEAELE